MSLPSPTPPALRALQSSAAQRRYLFLAASWASFAMMAVEMLFARIVASFFGSGIAVWGSIITVLLLAMAAGYLWGGRLTQSKQASSARFYQLLLWFALAMLPLVVMADLVLAEISYWIADSRYGSLVASALLLSAPGFLSGCLNPYALHLLVQRVQEAGTRAGQLNALTTLGAAAGTILPSYYLVLWWELNSILLGLVLITAALAAWALLAWPAATTKAQHAR